MTTLPDDFAKLKGLEMLLVAGNPLTLEGMRKLVIIQKKMKFFRDVTGKDKKCSLFVFMLCLVDVVFPQDFSFFQTFILVSN
jgi:hypothetical protein